MNPPACQHEYVKVAQYAYPVPAYWTCQKCSAVISDADLILTRIAELHAKVDRLTHPKAATDRSGTHISAGAPERPPDGSS